MADSSKLQLSTSSEDMSSASLDSGDTAFGDGSRPRVPARAAITRGMTGVTIEPVDDIEYPDELSDEADDEMSDGDDDVKGATEEKGRKHEESDADDEGQPVKKKRKLKAKKREGVDWGMGEREKEKEKQKEKEMAKSANQDKPMAGGDEVMEDIELGPSFGGDGAQDEDGRVEEHFWKVDTPKKLPLTLTKEVSRESSISVFIGPTKSLQFVCHEGLLEKSLVLAERMAESRSSQKEWIHIPEIEDHTVFEMMMEYLDANDFQPFIKNRKLEFRGMELIPLRLRGDSSLYCENFKDDGTITEDNQSSPTSSLSSSFSSISSPSSLSESLSTSSSSLCKIPSTEHSPMSRGIILEKPKAEDTRLAEEPTPPGFIPDHFAPARARRPRPSSATPIRTELFSNVNNTGFHDTLFTSLTSLYNASTQLNLPELTRLTVRKLKLYPLSRLSPRGLITGTETFYSGNSHQFNITNSHPLRTLLSNRISDIFRITEEVSTCFSPTTEFHPCPKNKTLDNFAPTPLVTEKSAPEVLVHGKKYHTQEVQEILFKALGSTPQMGFDIVRSMARSERELQRDLLQVEEERGNHIRENLGLCRLLSRSSSQASPPLPQIDRNGLEQEAELLEEEERGRPRQRWDLELDDGLIKTATKREFMRLRSRSAAEEAKRGG